MDHPPSLFSTPFCSSLFLWLLMVEFLVSIKIPSCSSKEDWYTKCSNNFTCGSLTATYPFWGASRPSGCGIPELQLTCQTDTTSIVIKNVKYRVLEIHPNTQIIRIVREDFSSGICSPLFINTSLDPPLLDFVSGYSNITFVYGCLNLPVSFLELFNCDISGIPYQTGYVEAGNSGMVACYNSVYFPVSNATLTAIVDMSAVEEGIKHGFEVQWNVDGLACNECTGSNGVCGYDLNSSKPTCYCPDQYNWLNICSRSGFAHDPASASSGNHTRTGVILAVAASVVAAMGVAVITLWYIRKRVSFTNNKTQVDQSIDAFFKNHGHLMQKRYSYLEIKKMTQSFGVKLGQGGYGSVFKGKFPDGRLVAVKVLKESNISSENFINEVASISRTSHVNIVALLGYCFEGSKRALIYEFMSNGSLDKYTHQYFSQVNRQLGYEELHQIALGIARGLEYLHRGCNTRILHFDIKPHNILLDENFCPKISDFGLAKICLQKESIVSMSGARGTAGYIAPEVFCRSFGGVSHKSDVYSYGMMVLEMVVGRKNVSAEVDNTSEIYFPDWIYKHLEQGSELGIYAMTSEDENQLARRMIIVSLWCIQTKPSDRPHMSRVIEMLQGSFQPLDIPPRPCLFSSSLSLQRSDVISSSTLHCESEEELIGSLIG